MRLCEDLYYKLVNNKIDVDYPGTIGEFNEYKREVIAGLYLTINNKAELYYNPGRHNSSYSIDLLDNLFGRFKFTIKAVK